MSILSEQAEHEVAAGVLDRLDKLAEAKAQHMNQISYIKKPDFKRKLEINEAYYKKLVNAGLREVILEDGDKTVWVSEKQFDRLMDSLAE